MWALARSSLASAAASPAAAASLGCSGAAGSTRSPCACWPSGAQSWMPRTTHRGSVRAAPCSASSWWGRRCSAAGGPCSPRPPGLAQPPSVA
eukprot:15482360-Alexandrium_andersonii.AAC.1